MKFGHYFGKTLSCLHLLFLHLPRKREKKGIILALTSREVVRITRGIGMTNLGIMKCF